MFLLIMFLWFYRKSIANRLHTSDLQLLQLLITNSYEVLCKLFAIHKPDCLFDP